MMATQKIWVGIVGLALLMTGPASIGDAHAADENEAEVLKELKEIRESVDKDVKAIKKEEKKAQSRLKKMAKLMQGVLKKCAVMEAEIKRTQKRLEDAEKLPAGDAESQAQRDSAIKTHEKRKKLQVDQLTKMTERGTKIEEELTKVHLVVLASLEKRREGAKSIVGGELRLARLGRKPLLQLAGSFGPRLDKRQGQALAEPMKNKGQRLTKKITVHVLEEGKEWYLFDETRRLGFGLVLNGDSIDVYGKAAKEERSKEVKAEERKLASSRKTVMGDLAKSEKAVKAVEALLKAFEETVSRNANR
ncbi:MAG: hypothetical protein P1V97_31730 [Planctomycetota bacterium]|nr:hypothetical protein [Planctomycetota bacterium]